MNVPVDEVFAIKCAQRDARRADRFIGDEPRVNAIVASACLLHEIQTISLMKSSNFEFLFLGIASTGSTVIR